MNISKSTRFPATLVLAFTLSVFVSSTGQAQCSFSCPTADETEVQAQLDALAAAGGGTLQLEPRLYTICQPWIVGSNTHLRGTRGVTTVRGSSTTTGKMIDGTHVVASIAAVGARSVTISDLVIDHVTCSRHANGISLLPRSTNGAWQGQPVEDALVENVEVYGAPSYHSYMIWNMRGRRVKIVNNWVDGGTTTEAAPQEGIETMGGHDVLISGNTVRNIGSGCVAIGSAGIENTETIGITVAHNDLSNCGSGVLLGTSMSSSGIPQSNYRTRIVGNTIRGARALGIHVPTWPGTCQCDLLVADNAISDMNATLAAGIHLYGNSGPLSTGDVQVATISGNQITNIRGLNAHGIRLSSYHDTRILDNTIRNTESSGIAAVNSNDVEITGNRVEYAGVAPIQYAAAYGGSAARVVIDNNIVRNWPSLSPGVLVLNTQHGTIRNNTFTRLDGISVTPALAASGSCGVTIIGNVAWYLPGWQPGFVPACPQ